MENITSGIVGWVGRWESAATVTFSFVFISRGTVSSRLIVRTDYFRDRRYTSFVKESSEELSSEENCVLMRKKNFRKCRRSDVLTGRVHTRKKSRRI